MTARTAGDRDAVGSPRWAPRHRAAVAVRRVLVYGHRWLGIAGALLIAAWFVSGVMMMYARMPRLSAEERLQAAAPLDLSSARVEPEAALRAAGASAVRLRIGMLGGRPVYRAHDGQRWVTVFADRAGRLDGVSAGAAVDEARRFAPDAATPRAVTRLTEPDQWTLQIRGLLPAQVVALDDAAGTKLYVAEQTGEVVLRTTRRSRALGYASAVLHWIYFTPIRRHSTFWAQLIIWTSIAGTVLCLSGLVWGAWRFSRRGRYRLRGVAHVRSPYAGWMKWHHYAGLFFGATTCTWVFSGLLSMNPWDWSPSTSPTPGQRDAFSGTPLQFDAFTLDQLRRAAAALAEAFPIKEIEVLQFRGELVAKAFRPPQSGQAIVPAVFEDPGAVVALRVPLEHRLVRLHAPERGTFAAFDQAAVEAAVRDAMPGVPVAESQWLTRYDAYYYGRCDEDPCRIPALPVLRVKFADPSATWLYADPSRGVIARREVRRTRLNRWLYHGLHSLDFPGLYARRPLWDLVVIALSVGGLIVTLSSAPAAWRRLRRHARRIRATMRG